MIWRSLARIWSGHPAVCSISDGSYAVYDAPFLHALCRIIRISQVVDGRPHLVKAIGGFFCIIARIKMMPNMSKTSYPAAGIGQLNYLKRT
ncbi:hypothetical protein GWI33_022759 [Rhynchophorus ferrugineus]|uniref:Uncharacterized protein n=1 Tax=Rhynchophorus ferrugineus TaxID=354439 RepID=A0A834J067_RHYFE|nr:hypothetical protein GWI33_022759 [Rhynchophorus ferrugineus]